MRPQASDGEAYHLLPEDLFACAAAGAAGSAPLLPALVPPEGVSYLFSGADGCPVLAPHVPEPRAGAIALEIIEHGGRRRLLAAASDGTTYHVNGIPALPATLLDEGDILHIPRSSHILHLVVQVTPRVQAVPDHLVGRSCPVCRVPFEPGTRVYVCGCDRVMHLQGEETPEAERLQCAHLASSCTRCGEKIQFTPQYRSCPEGLRHA